MSDTRINSAVVRGELDNTRMGQVSLRLWLIDRSEPVSIQLDGDCLRDLAGSHIKFENHPIEPWKASPIDLSQVSHGIAGEITASARLCMHRPNNEGGYHKPELVNVMRLEFFCELGRVVLEAFDFQSELLLKTWSMSDEQEFAQMASNFSEWQHHILKRGPFDPSCDAQELSYLYDEIHQRFADTIDFDQNEAALMGWDGVLSALAEEREIKAPEDPLIEALSADLEQFVEEQAGLLESPDETWSDEVKVHPVVESVQELIDDFEEQASHLTFPRGRHYQKLINTLDDIEEGISGLLKPSLLDELPAETCMIGFREYLGKMMVALSHFSRLIEVTETVEGRRELLFLRDEMLDLRESISALRFEMNNL